MNGTNETARNILYAKPSISQKEIDYVTDAAANGWGEHCYDYLIRFRDKLQESFQVRHAIPTSSCHGALHMALAALGVGPGDEVIVPDATWVGSVWPIVWLGATPVFVDILPDTWCVDPERIAAAIGPKTKAIIVVHLYGNLVEMADVLALAERYGLPVVEDAAEAIGAKYRGRRAGTMADIGVFSFHGTKTLTTGEGGAILTNRSDLADTLDVLENQGRNRSERCYFWCERVGYKYKMSNIQAALGLAQLERLNELVARKREVFLAYRDALAALPDLTMNPEPPHVRNAYWMPTVVLGRRYRVDVESLIRAANEDGIALRPFFHPVSSMPMHQPVLSNTNSYSLAGRAFNLPSGFDLNEAAIADITEWLKEHLATGSALSNHPALR